MCGSGRPRPCQAQGGRCPGRQSTTGEVQLQANTDQREERRRSRVRSGNTIGRRRRRSDAATLLLEFQPRISPGAGRSRPKARDLDGSGDPGSSPWSRCSLAEGARRFFNSPRRRAPLLAAAIGVVAPGPLMHLRPNGCHHDEQAAAPASLCRPFRPLRDLPAPEPRRPRCWTTQECRRARQLAPGASSSERGVSFTVADGVSSHRLAGPSSISFHAGAAQRCRSRQASTNSSSASLNLRSELSAHRSASTAKAPAAPHSVSMSSARARPRRKAPSSEKTLRRLGCPHRHWRSR